MKVYPPTPEITMMPRALLDAARRFNNRGGWVVSSHVAMSIMLAIFPFVLFIVALAGTVAGGVPNEDLIELVFGSWPEEIAKPIETELRAVLRQSSGGLLTLGGLLALFFASNGVDAVRIALTRAYRETDPRPFWLVRLLCVGFVMGGAAIIVLTTTFSIGIPIYESVVAKGIEEIEKVPFLNDTIRWSIAAGVAFFGVTACHVWLPGLRHPISALWPGIVLTLALWSLTAKGFGLYVTHFASYAATYAGLAGVIAALIFLNLMSAILILGAEFNGCLWRRASSDNDDGWQDPFRNLGTEPTGRKSESQG